MAFNFWIYQERDVTEPWAVHAWLLDNGTLDLAIYAEWIPSKSKKVLNIPATFDEFTDALAKVCKDNGRVLTVADLKQLNTVWVKMAISTKLI